MSTSRSEADLIAADLAHVWHPFTQFDEWMHEEKLVIERGEGVYLIDVQGRRYLDATSSLWCNVHGHCHPRLDAAARAQLGRIAHSTQLGLAATQPILLAEKLATITGLTRVFFSDSGATAVEVALKMAYQAQRQGGRPERTKFAALDEGYHGDTLGAVSVGGIDHFHGVYRPLLFDALRLPAPDRPDPEVEAGLLDAAATMLAEHGRHLAAFVFEPLVQGAAGMRMHSAHFLSTLCGMAREAGALLIADEVATGFGRTGTMWAMEQVGVKPDFLCLAKGITGGYLPLAATLTTEEIFSAFRGPYSTWRMFPHGHTYTGNPLACAVALANLGIFEEEAVIERLGPTIESLRAALAGLRHPWILERRQLGLMAAVCLGPVDPERRIGRRVALACRRHGVILRNLQDAIVLMPPLAMSPDDVRACVEALAHGIDEVASESV